MAGEPAAPVAGAALQLQKRQGEGLGRGVQWFGHEGGGGDGEDIFVHQFQMVGGGPVLPTIVNGGVERAGGEVEGLEAG